MYMKINKWKAFSGYKSDSGTLNVFSVSNRIGFTSALKIYNEIFGNGSSKEQKKTHEKQTEKKTTFAWLVKLLNGNNYYTSDNKN